MKKKKILSAIVSRTSKGSCNDDRLGFDPMGSYTGCPTDQFETPVQDADDL